MRGNTYISLLHVLRYMLDGNTGAGTATPTDRRTTLKIIGASAIGGFSGCTGLLGGNDDNSNGNSNDNELHVITSDTEESVQNFYNNVGEEFSNETGAEVNFEFLGFADEGVVPRVTQLVQGGNPPEIVAEDPSVAAGFLGEDMLNPLDSAMDEITNQYGDPTEAMRLTTDDTTYTVPFINSYIHWWYRNDLSDIEPADWESCIEYVQDVDENAGDIYGTYIPTGSGLHAEIHNLAWAYSNGTTLVREENGELTSNLEADRDKWRETLEHLQTLYQYAPTGSDSSFDTLINAIPTEQAASNPYVGARPKNASIDKDFAESVDNLELMPMNADDGMGFVGGNALFSIGGSNQELANEFVEFLFQEDYYYQLFEGEIFAPVHYTSPYPTVRESDRYWNALRENTPDAWSDEQIERVTYGAEENELVTLAQEVGVPNPHMGDIQGSELISSMFANVLDNDEDIDAALDEAHTELNDIMS